VRLSSENFFIFPLQQFSTNNTSLEVIFGSRNTGCIEMLFALVWSLSLWPGHEEPLFICPTPPSLGCFSWNKWPTPISRPSQPLSPARFPRLLQRYPFVSLPFFRFPFCVLCLASRRESLDPPSPLGIPFWPSAGALKVSVPHREKFWGDPES